MLHYALKFIIGIYLPVNYCTYCDMSTLNLVLTIQEKMINYAIICSVSQVSGMIDIHGKFGLINVVNINSSCNYFNWFCNLNVLAHASMLQNVSKLILPAHSHNYCIQA